jgi:hypothetical protein
LTELDYISEKFETEADDKPGYFDFLGKAIDTGFRISKFSEASRFVISAELAYLLCNAAHLSLFRHSFSYLGREPLKGVISGRPYPIIAIDTERSASRRRIRELENSILIGQTARPTIVRDFLYALMEDEKIESPVLGSGDQIIGDEGLPESYKIFKSSWEATVVESEKRSEIEEQAAIAEDGDSAIPDIVEQQLKTITTDASLSGGGISATDGGSNG